MATIVPVVLLLMNQQMKVVGPFLAVVVGIGGLTDVMNVWSGDEPLKHLIIKKFALAAGTALLTFNHVEQETEKAKGTSMAGVLSPRKLGPKRTDGQSGILLIGRVAICACFVFAAIAEMTIERPYQAKTTGGIQKERDRIHDQLWALTQKMEKIKKWENVDPEHKHDAIYQIKDERSKLNIEMKHLLEQDRGFVEQLIEQDGVLFFWIEAFLGMFIALGLFNEYIPKVLAVLLLIEAFNIEHYLSLQFGEFVALTRSFVALTYSRAWTLGNLFGWLDTNSTEVHNLICLQFSTVLSRVILLQMFADFSLVGCLLLMGKLGAGKFSVDTLINTKKD